MLFKDDDFWKPVITTRQIIEGADTITCVTLDEEGDWQALGNASFTDDDLMKDDFTFDIKIVSKA